MGERAFQEKQYALAAHIRDPERRPPPEGMEDRRLAIYRGLFFNNLKNLLATFFPVLRKLHDAERWAHFIREFMRRHRARTPYFLELPEEFLSFLQDEYEVRDDDFPFLLELAHYEYVELALSVSTEANDADSVDSAGNLLDAVPMKSALAWVYAYRYPVHRISPTFVPEEPADEPIYLAVYRQPNDEVGFLELNAATAGLLNAIDENETNRTGRQLLRDVASDIGYPDVDAFIEHGRAALEQMRELGILIGTRSVR